MNFAPQPRLLYAVLLERTGDPDRFESRFEPHPIKPIRLVLGWTVDDAGQVWPVLDGNRAEPWTGLASFHPTLREARAHVRQLERDARSVLRTSALARLLNRFSK